MASIAAYPFAGVICPVHGKVDIDIDEYNRQMENPDALWMCPLHQGFPVVASFDDERYEELNFLPDDDEQEQLD